MNAGKKAENRGHVNSNWPPEYVFGTSERLVIVNRHTVMQLL
jgi:hypothetical protein